MNDPRPDDSSTHPPPERISDQIRLVKAQRGYADTILLIQSAARATISLAIVISGVYLLVNQIPVPPGAERIAYLVLGAYFGVESLAAWLKRSNSK